MAVLWFSPPTEEAGKRLVAKKCRLPNWIGYKLTHAIERMFLESRNGGLWRVSQERAMVAEADF